MSTGFRGLFLGLLAVAGSVCAQDQLVSFTQEEGSQLLAGAGSTARIFVADNDWVGVQRAAGDLALDFGRVTGQNGSLVASNQTSSYGNSTNLAVVVGTLGNSSIIDALVSAGQIDVSEVTGEWESYLVDYVPDVAGIGAAIVIAGSDRRGSIYGIYELSQQIGVSPWYWWADVGVLSQAAVYATGARKVQAAPSVKYRGIFLNDEQPALTNWIQATYPDLPSGAPAFAEAFYSHVFELLLRLRANYLWPAMWNSMFYVDDVLNGKNADAYGIVMGTSHTEPMARATNEQQNPQFMGGPWAWDTNRANVTEFMLQGAERAKNYENVWTLGMRGHGDVASPNLNVSSLQEVVATEQQILQQVLNTTDLSNVPMMWCLYKEVGNYIAQGLTVPDDITLVWAEDNWGTAQRLPYGNETERSGGAGLYYHADYVGAVRDYKWINTISLQKQWSELRQAYERGTDRIFILNVGDLKPLELPIQHFLDMAYDMPSFAEPTSTVSWLTRWATQNFGAASADAIAEIVQTYSMLAARRKYELIDITIYSIINYDEANVVLAEWANLTASAQQVYDSLDPAVQPGFFEMVLHPSLAGYIVNQIYITAAKNNLYTLQGRNSANTLASNAVQFLEQDYDLAERYESLLDGKWTHMLDQTHLGYSYWQQPMRNSIPLLGYVQQRELSLAGGLGVTCDATNATVPGDDNFHPSGSQVLTLPVMDPYGPATRWIDVFSRGGRPVPFNVSISHPAVSISQSSGVLSATGNGTDLRLLVSVDWTKVNNATATVTINISTSDSGLDYINKTRHAYGNYAMPSIMLPLVKTATPSDFEGFVESDHTISIEAEHFSAVTNGTGASNETSPYLDVIPGYGRTLSGVALFPYTAASQTADATAPQLSYDFYTFSQNVTNANVTLYLGPALNTNPTRPLRYAVSVDDAQPTVIQPIPVTPLGTLPGLWTAMVSNAAASNTTTHDLGVAGKHTLNVWLLEPGLVLQKAVIDLGGVRPSYLGPPESYRQ